MSDVRIQMMHRKLQRCTTRCWSCWQGKGSLPPIVSCRRLAVLIRGRLYHRWFCESCILRIWGVLAQQAGLRAKQTPQQPLARLQPVRSEPEPQTTRPTSPFRKGQYIGQMLMQAGIVDQGMLATDLDECRSDAFLYARYAAPFGDPEEVRTIAAGILSLWASGCIYGRQA
jgi:hypothetical protein